LRWASSFDTSRRHEAEVNEARKDFSKLAGSDRAGFDLYKINCRCGRFTANAVVLSGLVVLMSGGAPNGPVMESRTIVSSKFAPSRFTGKANPEREVA